MIDDIEFAEVWHVAALASPVTERRCHWACGEGYAENAPIATALLADPRERELRR